MARWFHIVMTHKLGKSSKVGCFTSYNFHVILKAVINNIPKNSTCLNPVMKSGITQKINNMLRRLRHAKQITQSYRKFTLLG